MTPQQRYKLRKRLRSNLLSLTLTLYRFVKDKETADDEGILMMRHVLGGLDSLIVWSTKQGKVKKNGPDIDEVLKKAVIRRKKETVARCRRAMVRWRRAKKTAPSKGKIG